MSERRTVRVGDVAQVVGGGTPKTGVPEYWDGGLPWATPKDLSRSPVKWFERGERDISSLGAEKSSVRKVPRGTVLLTSRAPIGLVSLAARPVYTNQGFKSLILGDTQDPEYWYYLLKMSTGYLEARSSGSTFKELNGRAVANLAFAVPPLDEQRRIAAVLGAFDDLIETNRSLISQSTELAKHSILRASEGGAPVRVSEVAEVRRGLSYKGAGLADAGVPMVNMGSAAAHGWLKRSGWKYYRGDYKPRHVARAGDLILTNTEQTWRQEILGWPMLVPADEPGVLFTHHTYLVDFPPQDRWMRLALWAQLYTPALRSAIDGSVRGTTVANLPIDAVQSLEFRLPKAGCAGVEAGETLLHSVWADELEIADLTRTRDELLPLLMSGRVRVDDVEGMV